MPQKKINKKEVTICITTAGSDLNSLVDPRFGRCGYFLFIDEKDKLIKSISNQSQQAWRGAGIAAAQAIADCKAKIVITGNIGPNAQNVLASSGIKVFIGAYGISAKEALERYKTNKLQEVKLPAAGTGRFGPPPGGFGRSRGRGLGRRQ